MKKCSTPSCQEEAYCAGICKNCYNYIYHAPSAEDYCLARTPRLPLSQDQRSSYQEKESSLTSIASAHQSIANQSINLRDKLS